MRRIVKMAVQIVQRRDLKEDRPEAPWSACFEATLDNRELRQLCVLTEREGISADEFEQMAKAVVRSLREG